MNSNAPKIFETKDYEMVSYDQCQMSPSHLSFRLNANFYQHFSQTIESTGEGLTNRIIYAIQLVKIS